MICAGLTLAFYAFGSSLISLITDIPAVHDKALEFMPWLVAMPLVSMWCFLFDGIFVGATKGREMRNGMFISTCCYFVIFYLCSAWQNHALWLAMLSFMAIRGLTLALVLSYQWRKGTFLA